MLRGACSEDLALKVALAAVESGEEWERSRPTLRELCERRVAVAVGKRMPTTMLDWSGE